MTEPASSSRLAGRRILITGAASGIGLATAELFVAEGARVALLDRDPAVVDLAAGMAGAVGLAADVTDADQVEAAVGRAAEALGGLDGVVNSAGVVAIASLGDTEPEVWDRLMSINLKGVYLVCRAALPHLRAADGGGIVNISSNQALISWANLSAYAASKAGVLAFSRSLAAELAPDIRVNCICPGSIETPMSAANGKTAKIDPSTYALRRIGRASEVADGVLYLMADQSSYVTGITLAIDGGRTYH